MVEEIWKHFKNGAVRTQWRHDILLFSRPMFSRTQIKNDCYIFKFLRRIVWTKKYFMRCQSKTSVFKFLWAWFGRGLIVYKLNFLYPWYLKTFELHMSKDCCNFETHTILIFRQILRAALKEMCARQIGDKVWNKDRLTSNNSFCFWFLTLLALILALIFIICIFHVFL